MTRPDTRVRRLAILGALKAAPEGLSGEDLAASLGISRVAVRKHVLALRADGYAIDARAGSGYRLRGTPDAPLPAEVSPLLTSEMWVRLEGGGATGSTNDDCRALAASGAPEGTVVLASEQTGGRGRLGRGWVSPEGGVYLTALFRPTFGPNRAMAMSPAVGLGVALGLERLGVRVSVKWPNDVLLTGRDGRTGKVAGVLLESATEGEGLKWVIAGIGVNVRRPADSFPEASYLADEMGDTGLAEVAAVVLDGVAAAYASLVSGGFGGLLPLYGERDALRAREVCVRDAAGTVLAAGTVAGVDETGRLVVQAPDGERSVASGEVTLR